MATECTQAIKYAKWILIKKEQAAVGVQMHALSCCISADQYPCKEL